MYLCMHLYICRHRYICRCFSMYLIFMILCVVCVCMCMYTLCMYMFVYVCRYVSVLILCVCARTCTWVEGWDDVWECRWVYSICISHVLTYKCIQNLKLRRHLLNTMFLDLARFE